MKSKSFIPKCALLLCLVALALMFACKRGSKIAHGEPAYVAAPQVNLRDRLSAIYNRTGVVKNGERVEVLEKNRRFVRVRSPRGEEGWIEVRYLVAGQVFDALDQLSRDNKNTPPLGHGVTRAELKMHVTPGRDTDALFRLNEGDKVELLKRTTAPKPQPKLMPTKETANQPPPPPQLEDWWLVRDTQGHCGWLLARMVDVDIPMDIARYAEGQRIMAALVISQIADVDPDTGQTKQMPQYLTLVNDPKDGTPWDFNQIRIFTWNPKRHRYETAYRERDLFGVFPATVGHETFDNEGDLPFFTINVKDDNGQVITKKYKLEQPIVRRVLSPEEQRQADQEKAARLAAILQERAARRAARHVTSAPARRHGR